MTDETLTAEPTLADVMQELIKINKRFDGYDARFDGLETRFDGLEKYTAVQFEAVRQGIVDNNIRFDKLEGGFHLLRAEVVTLIEEVRYNRRVLV